MVISSELLGYLAACCTTLAFVPQAVRTIRTRDTRPLPLGMYLLFTCGVLLWLSSGALIEDTPLIVANTVTGLLAAIILFHKIKNDVVKKRPAE